MTMRKRLGFLTVATLPTVCVNGVLGQTGPYIQMNLGTTVAPPFVVHGSNNDWGTKCDPIINPRGVEVASECAVAPPLTSWANELERGIGVRAGAALGYDWGATRLESEYILRVTAYDHQSDLNISDDVSLDKREQEIELAVGGVDDLRSHAGFVNA